MLNSWAVVHGELHQPPIALPPPPVALHAPLEIEARARRSLRGFLASMSDMARREPRWGTTGPGAAAQLARILGRVRVHSTLVAELIGLWRRHARERAAAAAAALAGATCTRTTRWCCCTSRRAAEGEGGGIGDGDGGIGGGIGGGGGDGGKPASSSSSAAAAAAGEPFYWLGWNYLHKTAVDLASLPIGLHRPLLLTGGGTRRPTWTSARRASARRRTR